jgi:hypothetical protein
MHVTRFRGAPRPNNEVVDAIECLLAAAKRGQVKSFAAVVTNPLNEVETTAVGDVGHVGKVVLLGGMTVLFHQLLQQAS